MPKISVIVPVYNAEKYLITCVDSILSQTFSDFELLLINDGSTDTSGLLCDKYAQTDSRIKVFHKENGGVSSARNIGIRNSKGEFIYFMDSDDWIEYNALEICLSLISSHNADLIIFDYTNEFPNLKALTLDDAGNLLKCLTQERTLHYLFTMKCYHGYPWDKILRTEVVRNNNLLYDESLHFHEDNLFSFQYMINCSKILMLNYPLYHYNCNVNSSMFKYTNSAKFDSRYIQTLSVFDFENETLKNINAPRKLLESFNIYYMKWCARIYNMAKSKGYVDLLYYKDVKNRMKNLFNTLPINYKIVCAIFFISPKIYSFIASSKILISKLLCSSK